ncbi:Alginate biosynthesis transcriptional regulatory protein AlgB [Stieleria maiorica]|uniref:Alginate biosynthesis transcriptional regulatory protein AlgB n=1 Tax=Stieleria maiorica TaxID=2795974 RepID=A0A5B9M637_9BACT|nr:RNA repair transcriptional activator RtcR [Stieleria maiorica]QEF96628.1 Alginate biosynthesis transcriptional regulatory protein AlgB [Stieleria maiorica]
MIKKLVVIGLLGTKLDHVSRRKDRWQQWRPTVAACQQPDLLVDRLELLFDRKSTSLADRVAADIESVSPETAVKLHSLVMEDPWDFEDVYATLYSFARDYPFDTDREEYLIHITTGSHVSQICLFLLTESRHFPGCLLQTSPSGRQRGHSDPAGMHRIIDLDLSRYDQLAKRFQQEHRESQSFLKAGIETRDDDFNALIQRIEQVTLATTAPILLTGPTGAGKTQLAKRIFQLKRNRGLVAGDLVEVNCATIRGDQAMSTLFGHKKGAFTGATSDRPGLLKAADGGVLFLDEIGELGLDEQAMLLRAIEEKRFLSVGSDDATASDFQLIAGTNRDLLAEVAAGTFREDLLTRINLWTFTLPGLADRRDDIDPNLDFELARFAESAGRKVSMNRESRKRFLAFAADPSTPWRGNFRDLNAAVTRMATLASGGRIGIDQVDEEIARLRRNWGIGHDGAGAREVADSHAVLAGVLQPDQIDAIDHFDRVQLAEVIRVCRRSKSLSAAGRSLFQVSRLAKQRPNDADRLRKYLQKFGLNWDAVSAARGAR